ncbi:FKBP-type peptidyl-prolyl cis-trans isomerase [Haloarchaeobius amylolyticus]|uniref:FKBP-type peptidyl-prolyl cis-trans isomerase n=1 Tax=Haloarchaeobius amylolyticus TaxID=1198296 RepID=UPI0022708D53|nr:peptidylprolyl isomerase [Haloarchaeobius amylolyticus]
MTDDQEAELADAEDEVSEDAAAEEEAAEEAETTGLQDGDFIKLEYTARTKESDQLVDTTDPEVAEEEGVDDEGRPFEPRVIVLGEGHMFAAVEDELRGKEVGDSGHVTIPAAEAFGEYDDSQVRTVSAEKIPEDSRRPGAQVQIDGEQGFINTIIGGRARVDFNHPLAGEDLEYDYEIAEVVEDSVEKAQGLMHMFFDVDLDMWFETDEVEEEVRVESDEDDEDAEPEFETQTVEKETLYIESDPQLQMNQQWMFGKQQVAQQLMQHLDIDRVIVQETIDGGMGGMMGGMGGMMGGAGGAGGADAADIEEALAEADIDAEDIEADLDEE